MICYVCPLCKRRTDNMILLPEKNFVFPKKIFEVLEGVKTEILLCPCGKKSTWFEMERQIESFL